MAWGMPLHTIITADGGKGYLSVMSSDKDPLSILALRIHKVDWDANTADVKITNVMRLEEPGSKPSMLVPTQTDPSQPVTALWKPSNHQLHGPTLHPNGKFAYFTQWTDNKIRVIDVAKDTLAAVDPIQHGTRTRQLHGVFFNPAGELAISTGFYFDLNEVTLYQVDKRSGHLKPEGHPLDREREEQGVRGLQPLRLLARQPLCHHLHPADRKHLSDPYRVYGRRSQRLVD